MPGATFSLPLSASCRRCGAERDLDDLVEESEPERTAAGESLPRLDEVASSASVWRRMAREPCPRCGERRAVIKLDFGE